jgi:hypothetical protein
MTRFTGTRILNFEDMAPVPRWNCAIQSSPVQFRLSLKIRSEEKIELESRMRLCRVKRYEQTEACLQDRRYMYEYLKEEVQALSAAIGSANVDFREPRALKPSLKRQRIVPWCENGDGISSGGLGCHVNA